MYFRNAFNGVNNKNCDWTKLEHFLHLEKVLKILVCLS